MTDREFRKLKRIELIDIIYQLQVELEEKKDALEDKMIRIENAGSIAEAAVSLNELMLHAQSTADQYVTSVQQQTREEKERLLEAAVRDAERMREAAKEDAERIVKTAKEEADHIVTAAKEEAGRIVEAAKEEADHGLEKSADEEDISDTQENVQTDKEAERTEGE